MGPIPPRPDDSEGIRIVHADRVARITLSNPARKNALTNAMWGELAAAAGWAAGDPEVGVVVITGDGDDFCSGADLSGAPPVHALAWMRHVNEACTAVAALPKPAMARVDGIAAGAGLNLALACDLVVATDRARFSEIFVRRALSLDFGGSWFLPRRVGMAKAKELALLGSFVDADEALALGLVNRVVAPDELDAATDEWAAQLAAGPPIALAQTKALLDRSTTATLAEALAAEAAAQVVNFGTEDTAESIAAFLQKRTPRYRGR